jgi:Secretion system C-terminal sorting domain
MKFVKLLCLALVAFMAIQANAQQRYRDEIFTAASATTVVYGQNFTVLPLVAGGRPTRQPLVARVFTPAGDTETARPLVIFLKTGNFFPFPANGSCGGTITDSSNVEIATRLAKMGYVVAIADYRGGWNPTANDPVTGELTRRFTLINAAYRGVQDVRTCIRYFRRNVAEAGNQFGVDPTKIVVWGQGTGGYLSMATAYLSSYSEILTTSDPLKFTLPNPLNPAQPIPMVIEAYNGDIYGNPPNNAPLCLVDAQYSVISGGAFQVNDTLCVPNHVGYSSDFNLAVNTGGALGDTTWIDAGEIPTISYHVLTDPFAPCGTDVLNVPTAQGALPVMEVSGSCDVQTILEAKGILDVFDALPPSEDPMGQASGATGSGFYAFEGTPDDTSSPWEWTTAPPAPATCNQDANIARTYIDTLIAYYAPRACIALNLDCGIVGTNNINDFEVGLKVSPVPADETVFFSSEALIREIFVYDLNGRLVKAHTSINDQQFTMQRNSLANGLYIAEVRYDQGNVRKRLVFSNR